MRGSAMGTARGRGRGIRPLYTVDPRDSNLSEDFDLAKTDQASYHAVNRLSNQSHFPVTPVSNAVRVSDIAPVHDLCLYTI